MPPVGRELYRLRPSHLRRSIRGSRNVAIQDFLSGRGSANLRRGQSNEQLSVFKASLSSSGPELQMLEVALHLKHGRTFMNTNYRRTALLGVMWLLFVGAMFLSPVSATQLGDKDTTRQELLNFDRFLDSHPAIRTGLEENPRSCQRSGLFVCASGTERILTHAPRRT